MYIIGFSVDAYERFTLRKDCKNIVPLEEMTPKQRYEVAIDDFEDCVVYDCVEDFLDDSDYHYDYDRENFSSKTVDDEIDYMFKKI